LVLLLTVFMAVPCRVMGDLAWAAGRKRLL
jgi:hypothetical protein